jgi:hypothetical protein
MNCAHCGIPLPEKRRRNQAYCSKACSARASENRRKNGQPVPPRWQHPALTADDPMLRAAARHAQELGQISGWNPSTTRCALDGSVTVLTDLPAGERVLLSEVRARPHRWVSRPRLVEVLIDLDLLHDDSVPAIRSWIDHVTGSFVPGYITPVRQWLMVLLDGDTRSRSRSASSIYVYFGCIRPFLDDWAAGYDHLREVTRSDILISDKTAHGTGPISQQFVTLRMNHIGCTVDRIRKDRILHEALAARADPLHLSLVFGIFHSTAVRYSAVAEHLLSDELDRASQLS